MAPWRVCGHGAIGVLGLLFYGVRAVDEQDTGSLWDFRVTVLTTSLVLVITTLLLCWGEERGGRAPPKMSLRSERKNFRELVLPDAAVKLVKKPDTPPAERNRLRVMQRTAEGIMAWLYHGARTPWDDLALEKDSATGIRPLLVFVNSRSGGGQGAELLRELQTQLHRLQVVDLKAESPTAALKWWSHSGQRYRILVCGGDGTVGWVLGCLEELSLDYVPPVAILPIGTGNDLARELGWGGGYTGSSIVPVLQKVAEAHAAYLDRWSVVCRDLLPMGRPATLPEMGTERRVLTMSNYLGIGVDAAITLNFHQMRERRPDLFVSRLVNKAWYLKSGTINPFKSMYQGLASNLRLECDGHLVEVPSDVEGIAVLNIQSFAAGCDLWGFATDEDDLDEDMDPDSLERTLSQVRPSMQDRKLEVVAVHGSIQLGAAQVGLYAAQRLAQASTVKITNKVALPMQVDGEPWLFAKGGEIEISWKCQALMLARRASGSHAVATDVIDWALEKNVINTDQRNKLMQEIARRAQHQDLGSRNGSLGDIMGVLS